jgi:ribosomal RNA-processing protein 12
LDDLCEQKVRPRLRSLLLLLFVVVVVVVVVVVACVVAPSSACSRSDRRAVSSSQPSSSSSSSHASLSDVARRWRASRNSVKRQHAKVFDALSDAIRERVHGADVSAAHAPLSPAFYFAALLSALNERCDALASAAAPTHVDDDVAVDRAPRDSSVTLSLLAWLAEVLARLAAGVLFAQYPRLSSLLAQLLAADDNDGADVRVAALHCTVALLCHGPLSQQLRAAEPWRTIKPHAVALHKRVLLLALAPPDVNTRTAAVSAVQQIHDSPPPLLKSALSHATRRVCARALLGGDGDDALAAGDSSGHDALAAAVTAALQSGDDVLVNAQLVLSLLGADLPLGKASLFAALAPADASQLVTMVLACLRSPTLTKSALIAMERAASTPAALGHDDALRVLSVLCALPKVSGDVLSYFSDAVASLCGALGREVVGPILGDIVKQLLPMLRHTDASVARSAAAALQRVLDSTLGHVAELDEADPLFEETVYALEPICAALRDCLRAPYRSAWPLVLGLMASLAGNLGAACESLLGETLLQVAELYASQENDGALLHAMRALVAAMMRAMGPSKLLSLLPLQMDAEDFGAMGSAAREWLLPLLRENVAHSRVVSLNLVTDDLLPLADALQERCEQLQASDAPTDAVLARIMQQRVGSLWALLPLLCVAKPSGSDAATSFARLAPRLARALEAEPSHRAVVAQALAALIDTNLAALRDAARAAADADDAPVAESSSGGADAAAARAHLAVLSAQAPKFLPRLVNALAQFYDPNAGAQPNAVSTTAALCHAIGSYGRICAPEFAAAFFGRVLERLADAAAAAEALAAGGDPTTLSAEQQSLTGDERRAQRFFLTTVTGALAPAFAGEQAKRALGLLTPQLTQASDRRLQKVSFRALEAMCRDGSDEFFDEHWSAVIAPLLVDSMTAAVPSAKRLRLQCIASALERRMRVLREAADVRAERDAALGKKWRRRIAAAAGAVSTLALELMPSVILCTSEHSKRARVAAMELVDKLADAMRCAGDDGGADAAAAGVRATTFLEHVAAGLAGASPVMLAATTRVLGRVLRSYRELLSTEAVGRFCDIVFMLLAADDKQQAKAAVVFARAALSVNKEAVRERLPTLLAAMSRWLADPKHGFRVILRLLLERLVARFGYDAIAPHLADGNPRRVLTGIRQRATRKQRLRDAAANGTGAAAAAAAGTEGARKRRSGAGENDVLLADNDAPLDFLDSSSLSKVVSRAGGKKRGAAADLDDDDSDASDQPLKLTADGRLLVDDDDASSGDDVNDSDDDDDSDADSDDSNDQVRETGTASKQWKAKNKRSAEDAEMYDVKRSAVGAGDVARREQARGKKSSGKATKKAGRHDDDDDNSSGDDDDGAAAKPSEQSVRARRRTRRIESRRRAVRAEILARQGKGAAKARVPVKRPGAEFRAKRGRGDALKPGELQPYAYVPLNPAALNQRRRKGATADLVLASEKRKKKRTRTRK